MNGIAQLKQKIIERLAGMDMEKMGMGEMNGYIDLVNKVAAIQDRDYLQEYTEMLKGMLPGKKAPEEGFALAFPERN